MSRRRAGPSSSVWREGGCPEPHASPGSCCLPPPYWGPTGLIGARSKPVAGREEGLALPPGPRQRGPRSSSKQASASQLTRGKSSWPRSVHSGVGVPLLPLPRLSCSPLKLWVLGWGVPGFMGGWERPEWHRRDGNTPGSATSTALHKAVPTSHVGNDALGF